MHHPSGSPDDDSGALFGLDALAPGPAVTEENAVCTLLGEHRR
ncbi:hypothetical protein ABTX62_17595 [Streptomyces sp. NPDC096046]